MPEVLEFDLCILCYFYCILSFLCIIFIEFLFECFLLFFFIVLFSNICFF